MKTTPPPIPPSPNSAPGTESKTKARAKSAIPEVPAGLESAKASPQKAKSAIPEVPAGPESAKTSPRKAKALRYKAARYRKMDPDTGIVYSSQGVESPPPRKGGWLEAQLRAGVIIEV